ncbi:MAG: cysteine--tRNA ligase [Bacteroidales bacterium]
MGALLLYNTLVRKKQAFVPITPPLVGLYVCGPTVYGNPHLGHARPAITFDVLYRYLGHLGYKVRYVRNITDVGHLENDADVGEDKIAKKARLEQLEPMEVAQYYTNQYRKATLALNVLAPSIEPQASGHIMEQIELIEQMLNKGLAYQSEGSIYFDVEKYNAQYKDYGKLSGRVLDELQANTRSLDGQSEKRKPFDFALWKQAAPEHIMRWKGVFKWTESDEMNVPRQRELTSIGFPAWHLECSAMSKKYLGEVFDIHGGGMDLMFPHHECEIAQGKACGAEGARFWMHNNMISINGQKMGKSLGNFITLDELFEGKHPLLTQAYSPMTVRFFILQAHYRSTLDFSNDALQAAEKSLQRLLAAQQTLGQLPVSPDSSVKVDEFMPACLAAMNDDLNTAVVLAVLADWTRSINSIKAGTERISTQHLQCLQRDFDLVVNDILGLQTETPATKGCLLQDELIELLLNLRLEAKANKDFALSDKIRNQLTALGVQIHDTKEGFEWTLK